MKRASASVAIREMHIKPQRYHFIAVRMAIINQQKTSAGKVGEKRES